MILHALVLAVNAAVMAVCVIGAAWMLAAEIVS